MKKLKSKNKISENIKPADALKFLEDFRLLGSNIDGPKKMISIRLPENLIRNLKNKAKIENKKYQALIIESIRSYLKKNKVT